MALDSISGIKDSRPTLLVGGKENAALVGGLLSLSVAEDANGLYCCEAKFGNWGPVNGAVDFLYFDRKTLDFGQDWQVKLGDDMLFDGRVTALEANFPLGAPPEITVLAEDRLQDLRMTRRSRAFENMTDADVARRIAGEHGLTPEIDLNGPTHQVLAQINQSDLAFLRERVRALDAEIWVNAKTLGAKPRAARSKDKVKLTHGTQLREFNAIADLANQCTSVTASGWDVAGKSALFFEAKETVISNELNGDTSGAAILQQKFGTRKESLAHAFAHNSRETQFMAEALFRMTARRFVVGHGVAEPNAKMRVGTYVELDGLGPLFNGKYYLAQVKHLFDNAEGMRTVFCAEKPGIGK